MVTCVKDWQAIVMLAWVSNSKVLCGRHVRTGVA